MRIVVKAFLCVGTADTSNLHDETICWRHNLHATSYCLCKMSDCIFTPKERFSQTLSSQRQRWWSSYTFYCISKLLKTTTTDTRTYINLTDILIQARQTRQKSCRAIQVRLRPQLLSVSHSMDYNDIYRLLTRSWFVELESSSGKGT